MAETLFLIDGHALVYRAFYAIEGLTAPDGRPTGAILGFTRMVQNCIDQYRPEYVVAVFDAPGKNFRHEMFSDYKATRKPTPPELIAQVPTIQDIVRLHRIPVYTLPGYEADDLLGTFARQAAEAGLNVVIITGDKDCAQLLNERVRILDPQKNKETTEASFRESKGIDPKLLPDLMGLWGDTADNIPGVPGIGEKIGAELIKQYGTLDNLLEHAGEIKGKRGETIRANVEQAKLSRQLAIIKTDAPMTLDIPSARRQEPDTSALVPLYQELGFKQLLHQMGADKPKHEDHDYILVNTPQTFAAFIAALRHETHISLDTETTGLDPMQAELVGISLSWAEKTAYYLPVRAPQGEPVLSEAELRQLAEILENEAVTKTGQNLKYDAIILRRHGIHVRGIVFDSLLAASLIDSGSRALDLDTLALRHLSIRKIPTEDLIGSGAKQTSMADVPLPKICKYACEDADVALRLHRAFEPELRKRGQDKLFYEVELPLSRVLTEMQLTGVRVDTALLGKQSHEVGVILAALTQEIHALSGREFNIASPKQLGQILFEEMGLPVVRKTKTGPSTDEETLSELSGMGYELPERILNYRMYAKLKSTYLDALPEMVHPETGRIHTTFSQTGTATGRLSSSSPNLQNIPIRTQSGRAIRAAFVPQPGWKMLAADYSQIELRVLAHFCEDEVLLRAFAEGLDIHRVVAAEVNHIRAAEVTSEQRSAAKAVNFGILYGQTAHGLARTTGMNRPEAQNFIDRYFARFPRVRDFIDATIARATEEGGVATILGRRRELPELQSNNKALRARAEREAVNTLIQGSAADLIKTAMVNLHRRMKDETPRSRMLLQIHDELVFESPEEEVPHLTAVVREEMENAMELRAPLTVELGVGNNWLEVK